MVRVLLMLTLLAAARAHAQTDVAQGADPADEPTWEDRVVVPSGTCLDHHALSQHLATWLGPAGVAESRRVLVSFGVDERTNVSFVLLENGEAIGERRFDVLPADCSDRRAALSLAIAIALDNDVLARIGALSVRPVGDPIVSPAVDDEDGAEPEGSGNVASDDALVAADSDDGTSDDRTSDDHATISAGRRRLNVGMSLRGALGGAVLPRWHAAAELSLVVGGARWSIRVGGWATSRTSVELAGGTVEVQALAGVVLGCIHTRLGRIDVSGCGGALLGAWFGAGKDFDRSVSAQILFGGVVGDIGLRVPADAGVAFTTGVRVVVPITGPTFAIHNASNSLVAETSASYVGAEGYVGVEISFR